MEITYVVRHMGEGYGWHVIQVARDAAIYSQEQAAVVSGPYTSKEQAKECAAGMQRIVDAKLAAS